MREPNYEHWLTTHWPPLIDRPYVPHVYLQDQHKAACGVKPGHRMLVYEYKYGPLVVDQESGQLIRRHEGREGIILAVQVTSDFSARPEEIAVQDYEGRVRTNWKWEAKAETVGRGYVSRAVVNKILGFRPRYNFFGFNHGKGYRGLTPEQYGELLEKMTAAPPCD